MTENQPQEVDWDKLMNEIEEKCGRDVADAIRHRLAVLDRRIKDLEIGQDEEPWEWWT